MSDSNSSRKKKVVTTKNESADNKDRVAQRKSGSSTTDDSTFELLFKKKNYTWVFIGLAFLLLGFLLMIGGEQSSPDVWEPEKIYSFRRITLAPILILLGLGIQIYAIFKK